MACCIIGNASDQRFLEAKRLPELLSNGLQHTYALCNNLRPNSITCQNCYRPAHCYPFTQYLTTENGENGKGTTTNTTDTTKRFKSTDYTGDADFGST